MPGGDGDRDAGEFVVCGAGLLEARLKQEHILGRGRRARLLQSLEFLVAPASRPRGDSSYRLDEAFR